MEKTPKLKRDWKGRKVRLLRKVETRGGDIFPVGAVMTVYRNHGGLTLDYVSTCERCGLGKRFTIKGISESAVELLPKEGGE